MPSRVEESSVENKRMHGKELARLYHSRFKISQFQSFRKILSMIAVSIIRLTTRISAQKNASAMSEGV